MSDLFKAILEKFEVGFLLRWILPFLFILASLVGLALLHPPAILARDIDLTSLPKAARTWIAIGTLTTGIAGGLLLLFSFVHSAGSAWKKHQQAKKLVAAKEKLKTHFEAELETLGPDEVAFIGICLARRIKTVTVPATCPAAIKLSQRGMLQQVSGLASALNFPYSFNAIAWELLMARRPELLDLWGIDTTSDRDLDHIWQNITSPLL